MITRQTTLIVDPTLAAAVKRIDGNVDQLNLGALKDVALGWSATTTAPALLNGTSSGKWALAGKMCYFEGLITTGSGTTYGAGNYYVNLPIKALSGSSMGHCLLTDVSTGAIYPGVVWLNQTTLRSAYFVVNQGLWTPTGPFTLAAGDSMRFSIWYPWDV